MFLKTKNFIFYFIIAYMIIFSVLYIGQIFKVKQASEKKLESDVNIEHVKFLNESVLSVEDSYSYKSGSKCSSSIRDAILTEKAYRYAEVKTYKELYKNFYDNVIYGDNYQKSRLQLVNNVLNDCNLNSEQDSDSNKINLRKELLSHATYQVSTLEYSFRYDYLSNLSVRADLALRIINSVAVSSFNNVRAKNKADLRSMLIKEQKEFVQLLLDVNGGIYE